MNINEQDLEFASFLRYELQEIAEKRFKEQHVILPKEKAWDSYETEFKYGEIYVTFRRSFSGCSCCNETIQESYDIKDLFKSWLNNE